MLARLDGAYGGSTVFTTIAEENPDKTNHIVNLISIFGGVVIVRGFSKKKVAYAISGTPWVMIGFEDMAKDAGSDMDYNDVVVGKVWRAL